MSELFDDITRIVGSRMPRRQALRLISGAFVGAVTGARAAGSSHKATTGNFPCQGQFGGVCFAARTCHCQVKESQCNGAGKLWIANGVCCSEHRWCNSNEECCRIFCCKLDTHKCVNGRCCPLDKCCKNFTFCCPPSRTCIDDQLCCPSATDIIIGGRCCPQDKVCDNNRKCCETDQICCGGTGCCKEEDCVGDRCVAGNPT